MDKRFSSIAESLLAGEVICRFTREYEYGYLDDDDNFKTMSDYLWRLGRRIRRTIDENGFILVHLDTTTARAKQEAKQAFEEVNLYIRPFVLWLALARRCEPMGRPLKAGDSLRESELLSAIEDSKEITRELDHLCRMKPFQNDSQKPKGQLSKVLHKLVEMGYLVEQGHSKTQFRATAKLSLFYDMLDFIREYEDLQEDVDDSAQMKLDS